MTKTTAPDERPLDTVAASKALAELGFSYAPSSLDRMRSVGGGPKFLKMGARVYYRPQALRDWIQGRTREMASTSTADDAGLEGD
jgi:hypothetical protein